MADYMELKERQQQDNTTLGEKNGGLDVVVKQPGKDVTPALLQPLMESSEHRHRRRTISDSTERRIRGRKERDRRRLKQLEEDEMRRRERRKRQRLQQAKNIGQKSIYDAESKRVKEVNMLNEIDRKDFEREMDKVLADGDLDDITAMVTAHKLTKCKTNSLEKSLEVSYKLNKLADTNYPDAEDFHTLANKVEDFSIKLLEPLKSDDMKRAIFEGEDFDRISEKSVLFRQKKFISHPVVYNLLMKRWAGAFHHLRQKSWRNIGSIKWLLLTIWTVFDVVFFPFVFTFLYMIHVIVNFSKKECHAIVITSPCSLDSLEDMQDLSSACFAILRPQHTTLICDQDKIEANDDPTQQAVDSFMECLKSARKKFKHLEKAIDKSTDKLLVIMTDDKVDASFHELTKQAQRINNEQVRIVSVGFGIHPEIKELETMAIKQQNVFLYHGNVKLGDIVRKMLEALRGKDIFDKYVQYFNTPYFIFVRDTLSYLALLGLHFAVCLQHSTLHFTALEWVIMLFFIGRLLMEIDQAIMEKHLSHKFRKQSRNYEKLAIVRTKSRLSREKPEESDEDIDEIKRAKEHSRKNLCRVCFNIMTRYLSDYWNILDLITLLVYIIILILRSITWAEHFYVSNNRLLAVAGYFYGLNTMFLTLRVCGHIMESTKYTGSIQIALIQIIGAVVAIFGQFLAATLAFSLAITKVYVAEISYTAGMNSTSHGFCKVDKGGSACWWESVTHLLWSLLGDPNIEPLTSSDGPSDVLAKLLYGIFLIMAVVMLMNMMIALLSNTYQEVEDNAFYEWSYRRATTIRTYINYHPIPVPFNIISFALVLCRRFYKYICCSECCVRDDKYMRKRRQAKEPASFFDCLVFDLQAEYFSKHGYAFPLAESNKMDWVFKETEGNRRLIGHIANQIFTDEMKAQLHLSTGDCNDKIEKLWETRGIAIKGHQLTYDECNCEKCNTSSIDEETRNHGATFLQPLSKESPGFEVLIQESLERRLIVIGVVPDNWYSSHDFAGCQGNSAGYHVDEGKIFDLFNQKIGIECEGAMAHRGDLIGCKILFNQSRDDILMVSFTLNGKVIGEAKVQQGKHLYPFIGIGWEGITLLFKKTTTNPVQGVLSPKDQTNRLLQTLCTKIDNLQMHYEDRQLTMLDSIAKLERKVDILYQHSTLSHNKNTLQQNTDSNDSIQKYSMVKNTDERKNIEITEDCSEDDTAM